MIAVFSCRVSDPPDAPGTPDIVDWDKDFVDLKWMAPVKDGGSPITGYLIEKKEVGTVKWTKAVEASIEPIIRGGYFSRER